MGDPKRQRKKYSKPPHPWLAERIEEEKALIKEFGLKNKKEIWKVASLVRKFSTQAKRLIAEKTEQARVEEIQLLNRLKKLNLATEKTHLEDVLGLEIKDILERRLQTLLFKKGLARSMNQARQFITHGHVLVGNKKITVPGFLVPKKLEPTISFAVGSPLFKEEHPERAKKAKMPKKKEKIVKKEKSEKKKQTKKPKETKKNETKTKETKTK